MGEKLGDNRGKHKNHSRSAKHHLWNNGSIRSKHGYVKIRVGVSHPLAEGNGYAYEHLVVWVSSGRAKPAVGEVIHHKNHNKTDNRIENLELKSSSKHGVDHHGSLSDADVRAIRQAYASRDKTMPELAVQYQLPIARISKYIRGEVRKAAGGPVSTDNRKNANLNRRKIDKTPFPQSGE